MDPVQIAYKLKDFFNMRTFRYKNRSISIQLYIDSTYGYII
jgi:hypothetical protein